MTDQLTFWAVTLLMAAGGAWFGSYLREKGKNYATREDVQALTRLTEEVRADISGKMWLDQKRWDLKRDFYWKLLAEITALSIALRNLRTILKFEDTNPDDLPNLQNRIESSIQIVQNHEDALVQVLGIGRILLSEEVVEVLNSYQQDLRQIEERAVKSLVKYRRPKHEVSAMHEMERAEYTEKFLNAFPHDFRKVVDDFRTKHNRVLPEVIKAARLDLLSLSDDPIVR